MSEKLLNNQNTRNYGIDLLRVLAMVMIVIDHVIAHGGVALSLTQNSGVNYYVILFLTVIVNCAVNCYGLVSGYVLCGRKTDFAKLIELWFTVFFYSVAITLLFNFFSDVKISTDSLVNSFFPVYSSQYWYFTAYFAMFFFIPFFNLLIEKLSQKQHGMLILACVFLFSLLNTISINGSFNIGYGRSFVWLSVLYFIGAYLKNYGLPRKLSKGICILLFFALGIITFGIDLLLRKNSVEESVVASIGSPLMLLMAVCLLICFVKTKVNNKAIIGIIKFVAPLNFSVYLISENPKVFNYIILNKFTFVQNMHFLLIPLVLIGIAIAIYLACIVIDFIRTLVFKGIKIKKLAHFITKKISNFLDKIFSKTA